MPSKDPFMTAFLRTGLDQALGTVGSGVKTIPIIIAAAGLPSVGASLRGADRFSSNIEPILKQRCYECHSHEKKMKGGLTLDSKSGWEQGGDSGPAIVVGKPEESLLIKMVRWADEEHQMPPKEKLPRRRSRCWKSGSSRVH